MAILIALLLLTLIGSTLYGVLAIVWPLPPLRSRKSWLGVTAASVIGFGIVTSFLPTPPAPTHEPASDDAATKPKEAEERNDPEAKMEPVAPLPAPEQTPNITILPEPKTALDLIKDAGGRQLQSVEEVFYFKGLPGKAVRVSYALTTVPSESNLISIPAIVYLKAAEIIAREGDEYSGIEFLVRAESLDAYNMTEMSDVITWRITRSELKKIEWQNFSSRQLLGLSDVKLGVLGRSAVRAFCEGNPVMAAKFCRRALQ